MINEDLGQVKICEHCKGWGIQHIPVTGTLEICKVCEGNQVKINYKGEELFWGGNTIADLRPNFLTLNFYRSKRFKNFMFWLFIIALIAFIIFVFNRNFYTELWIYIQDLFSIT